MGCCLSKTDPTSPSPAPSNPTPNPHPDLKPVATQMEQRKKMVASVGRNEERLEKEEREKEGEGGDQEEKKVVKKKEVFVIQHRKSNDKRSDSENGSNSNLPRPDPNEEIGSSIMAAAASGQVVRTSSCTKEEVDAILIQCGRLSRSSSGKGNTGNSGNGRRYSGSKRSFDFDRDNEIDASIGNNNSNSNSNSNSNNSNGEEDERLRRRQSRGSHRRRSTLSRSRERGESQSQSQRSGSRERERGDQGSRRVSRSPGRRSESPLPGSNGNVNCNNNSSNANGRPVKLVSVPATVTSLSVEKGSNNNGGGGGEVKRVLVKRNVGSPRSQSPSRGNGGGVIQQQQPSLSRNGSRKAEQSPYRRTPLNEIDMNSLPLQPLPNKRPMTKGKEIEEDGVVVVKQPVSLASQNKHAETHNTRAAGTPGTHRRTSSRGAEGYEVTKTNYCRVNELQTPDLEYLTEHKGELVSPTGYDALVTPVIVSGSETLKLPQTLMRSRSSRRSRDLDINVDALINPIPATDYNSLLLQDIQNFHHSKSSNTNNNNTSFSLPPCVTKACSILEAVADLNSSTDDRRVSPRATAETASKNDKTSFSFLKRADAKDPFVVESEVKAGDDLMEPSFHKYVTVRKRGGDLDGEESSGSNSFVAGTQNWVSSSSWEPNSADSTDCWTSKSYTREEGFSPVGFQRHAISDFGCGIAEESEKKCSKNTMEKFDHQQQIGGAHPRITSGGQGPIQASKAAVASM
ncbi:hypothetical protein Cgig2_031613 [Carnegiea gigantea]|uniref:Uncharacterized protein n=1 Tax=Carnegiea gigantea TaxID=171969 RepID=A0A9Q1Q9X3_9CARY|nr:hypothetical protein Cgig2_031613 [Carnegiea gigantea]